MLSMQSLKALLIFVKVQCGTTPSMILITLPLANFCLDSDSSDIDRFGDHDSESVFKSFYLRFDFLRAQNDRTDESINLR